MSTGLIALLDDVAALAKLAAASLDDVAAQAVKAGTKAAGIVIDDAAVTPRYVAGLTADRELPIIKKIAFGSLKNKLILLLPGALLLSVFAPWAIPPMLMFGGAYLCLEGYHKVRPGGAEAEETDELAGGNAQAVEDERVASAIRTDLILSAEIMAISLAGVAGSSTWMQAVILAVVGTAMTILVYGAVALIVKADDAGLELAKTGRGAAVRAAGRFVVTGMPGFLKVLSGVGMLAMLWVGGGIVLHGVGEFGWKSPERTIHHVGEIFGKGVPFVEWMVRAALDGVVGLAIGAAADSALKPLKSRL